jgi:hypothetical protein
LASSIQTNREPEAETLKTMRTHQKREWGGIVREQAEAIPLRSVVATVSYAEGKDFHESHAEDKRFHKSHAARRIRSPDRHNQRKRNGEDDERLTKVFKFLNSCSYFAKLFGSVFICLQHLY